MTQARWLCHSHILVSQLVQVARFLCVDRSLSHLVCLGRGANWEDCPTGWGQATPSHSRVWTGFSVGRSGPAQDLARLWLLGAGVLLRYSDR